MTVTITWRLIRNDTRYAVLTTRAAFQAWHDVAADLIAVLKREIR